MKINNLTNSTIHLQGVNDNCQKRGIEKKFKNSLYCFQTIYLSKI